MIFAHYFSLMGINWKRRLDGEVAGANRDGPVAPALAGGGPAGYVPKLSFPICDTLFYYTRSLKRLFTAIQ